MYLADGDACRSNLSLCVCDIYDFDPVLPISGMQETTHWAHWYSQWLPQILTGRLCQSKFSQSSSPPPPPFRTILDIFLLNILSCKLAIIIPVYLLVVLHVPQLALSQEMPHRSPTQWTHKYQYLFSTSEPDTDLVKKKWGKLSAFQTSTEVT